MTTRNVVSAGVRLSGAVMCHPRRLDMARSLAGRSGAFPLRLAVDPEPDGPPTTLRSAMRAWSSVEPGATHHLVLQDDAVPGVRFFERLHEVVRAAPHAAISFFTSWNSRNGAAVRQGALLGARWVRATAEYTPTVALVLPAEVARGFADYARRHGTGWPDDVVMRRYLVDLGVDSYLTVPNLVEHDAFESVASNGGHGLRRAACFAPLPAEADWNLDRGLVDLPVVPLFKHGTALCAVRGADGRWTTEDGDRYSGRLGFVIGDFRKQLYGGDGLIPFPADFHPVRAAALDGLCVTAGLVGLLNARAGAPPVPWHRLVRGDYARTAIGTLAPGGLCGELDVTGSAGLADRLAELAAECMRLGAAHDAAPRTSRPARGRIVVAGTHPELRDYVARDLAHQGFQVVSDSAEALVHIGRQDDASRAAELAAGLKVGHLVRVELGAGTTTAAPADPHPMSTVLRVGVVYGPGIVEGNALMLDFVTRALTRRPIRIPAPLPDPVEYLHAADLCRAIERSLILRRPASLDLGSGRLTTATDLAEAVCAAVRNVPVETDGPGADGSETAEGGGAPLHFALRPPSAPAQARPLVSLEDGLRSVSQWLAYEADPAALLLRGH